jgi:phosphoenolpyruvate carboxylase
VGYVPSALSIYEAQERLAQRAQRVGVVLTVFHGRGGAVGRGGGPASRAIRAQPPQALWGRLRVTEQGETIAARYASAALAHRHIEQIVHAVLMASSPAERAQVDEPAPWRAAMDEMSRQAVACYRQLVYDTPGFIAFWQVVTPLDEIKRLHIGSRPAARAQSSAVNKIRAIPWVFSWMQSRFNLPAWYSLGTALQSNPDRVLLREMYAGWPFFKTMLDNTEISLVKADMEIAALYVDLVPDRELARRLFSVIRAEYERTRDMLLVISGRQNLMEHEPITRSAVQLRNPYIDPLYYIQVEMLRRLRALPNPESAEAAPLREVVVLTINGIAAGLRNTG